MFVRIDKAKSVVLLIRQGDVLVAGYVMEANCTENPVNWVVVVVWEGSRDRGFAHSHSHSRRWVLNFVNDEATEALKGRGSGLTCW